MLKVRSLKYSQPTLSDEYCAGSMQEARPDVMTGDQWRVVTRGVTHMLSGHSLMDYDSNASTTMTKKLFKKLSLFTAYSW